jgi:hypothetical protein
MLNAVIFTNLTVDALPDKNATVIGAEYAEPFDNLIPAAHHHNQHGTIPAPRQAPDNERDQARHHTATTPGPSSSKTTWVPPARLVQHLHETAPAVNCWFPRPLTSFDVAVVRAVMRGERRDDHHRVVRLAGRRSGLRGVRS